MQVNTRDVPLLPGAQAPEFRVARFVKGSPVAALEPGQIYVLEFWATWCGPCIENIPHISALQAEHPDVVFIGIAIDKEKSVEDFVAQSGERMAYRVALDLPLAEADGTGSSWMKINWLAAAERTGIPDAFIVDGAGRIAWIGYPAEIGDVLPHIKDGSWDVAAFRQEYAAQVAEVAQMRANLAALSSAAEAQDWTAVVAQCEALLSNPSGMEPMLISEKLKALGHLDVRRARDYAEAEFAKADGRQGMSTHIALARACSTLVQELSAAGNAAEAAEFSRMGLRYIDAVKVAFEDLQKLDPQSASPFSTTDQSYKVKDVFGNTDITFGNSLSNTHQTIRHWNLALTNPVAGPLQDYMIGYSYQINDVQSVKPSVTFASKFETFNNTLKVGYDYRSMVGSSAQANGLIAGTLDITQKTTVPLDMDMSLTPGARNSVASEGYYAIEKVDLFDKKLHLLGSIRRDTATYSQAGGGVSADNESGANSFVTGATYDLTPTTAPYVNYSKGIVLGYIDQFGTFVQPEGRELREVGVRQSFFDNKLSATLSAFQLTQTNTSFAIPSFTGLTYITTAGIESKGTELEVQGEVMEGWNIIGSLSKIDLTNLNSANPGAQFNIAVPQWKGSIWSTYSFATQNVDKITFGAGLRAFSSSSTLVNFNIQQPTAFPVAGYGIVDAMIAMQKGNWDLQLKVNNVLNDTPIAPSKVGLLLAHEAERTWMFTARTKF